MEDTTTENTVDPTATGMADLTRCRFRRSTEAKATCPTTTCATVTMLDLTTSPTLVKRLPLHGISNCFRSATSCYHKV
ncbi:hypothetical protein L596_029653 [Steinernema carpocapsae]|uniref:Uncharacterized protein n=1 Tax=Steinernema carpocapsae TaxID=34508 RepID=A0A4U5LVB6_STECR|nr:hypothetical protein L596_029653 [Steinernema carpocapsae]